MPRETFTDRAIRALQPKAKRVDYVEAGGVLPGFGLRVTPNGVKTWTVIYRNASGRLRRLTLGKYPLISLADARKAAHKALASVVQGADPASEKQARRDAPTFADVARAHIAHRPPEDAHNAALFKLYLLTAQRGGELRTMRWEEVDLDGGWWTIPAERAKNGRTHRVPLSPPALSSLRALPRVEGSPWVFPSPRAASGCRENIGKAVDRIRKASGVDFWPHDLRRSAASPMTSMSISRLTVAKVLNHVERGVTAVYDRHSYDAEKRQALDAWARRLNAIVSGETASAKVIPLRA